MTQLLSKKQKHLNLSHSPIYFTLSAFHPSKKKEDPLFLWSAKRSLPPPTPADLKDSDFGGGFQKVCMLRLSGVVWGFFSWKNNKAFSQRSIACTVKDGTVARSIFLLRRFLFTNTDFFWLKGKKHYLCMMVRKKNLKAHKKKNSTSNKLKWCWSKEKESIAALF